MPATTTTNSSNKKSEVELVSERVTKTKKEIEQLKAQLQKLIDDGISKSDFTETKQNVASLSNECKTDITHNNSVHNCNDKVIKVDSEIDLNKAKNFKDSVSDLVVHQQPVVYSSVTRRRKDKSPLKEAKDESPKKTRHYDQEAAREYIKKQKEKRRESIKNKNKEVGFTQDMKKQRLHELRQKSLQLLSKNIQHKRERSRSRSQDNLDQHEHKLIDRSEGKVAQIKDKFSAEVNIKSVNAASNFVPNVIELKSEFSTRFAHPQLKNITVRSNMRHLSAIPKLNIPKHIQFDIDSSSTDSSVDTQSTHRSGPLLQQNTEEQPNSLVEPTQFDTVTPLMRANTGKVHTAEMKSPKFPQSAQPTVLEKHKAAIKIQTAFRGYRQRNIYRIALKTKQKVKEQATKEVQTVKIKSDVPKWLQAPAALPYPYNFINTVKRKLNLAVQQTTVTNDVAVQSSLIEEKDNTLDKTEQSPAQRNSNKKNTDLKSFLSHKCLDLDMKAIEPLALTRNSSLHDKKSSLHCIVPNPILKSERNGFASDSDTSKNIPEISSESSAAVMKKQHSSKRAHSSDTDHDDKPKINTDKIKKLKLLQPKRLNFSSESVMSHESSKLSDDISEHITEANSGNKRKSKSLSNFSSVAQTDFSGRDSIIASNKCNYSQNKTNQKPVEINSNLDLTQHKSSENSIKSTEPIIPPQDTLSSFRNYMQSVNDEKPMEEDDSDIKTQMSSEKLASENSKHKEISAKASTEILDVNNPQSGKSESTIKTHNSLEKLQEYSSNFTSVVSTVTSAIPSLKRPNISLKSSQRISNSKNADAVGNGKTVTSIILKPGEKTAIETSIKSNEIHLKFEAQLHLLNEFNDSLRQIMAMDKSLLELRNNNSNTQNNKSTTTYQTRDTQTSIVAKSSTDTKITTESLHDVSENYGHLENKNQNQIPTINYSRGSEISEQIDIFGRNDTIVETNDTSLVTTGLELSELKDNVLTSSNEETNVDISVSFAKDNLYNKNVFTGLSLEMFEQLIKDEDARIENLKTILKIREKALVDRTKGELAWLEIQKKHLRDSGQLQEISAIKKKQRGLLIKLEHERHEMQRLKQMQKAASKERKSVLREQRNMIKAQLSNTSTMITKIKRNTKEERRHSGPLKVYNIKSHSESIRSETSMSRRSSVAEEIISVVSHSQSIISHVTEEAIISNEKMQQRTDDPALIPPNPQVKTEHVKRSLLMREVALQKRRKAAEELLQWHQRLIEEEEKIAELELAASAIINQIPTVTHSMLSDEPVPEKHKFKGSQLNLLWYNMTGREEKKFNDDMTYTMSKISLERFCKDAKKYAIGRSKSFNGKKSGKVSDSDSSLSAIDITVTELTHSKHKNSNSEKCKKFKSKSPQSSSEIASQIVISKRKSKDSQDYTSDFESLLSINKESGLNTVSTDDEQKILDETIIPHLKQQSKDSKMLAVGEISQSDKEIETIAEQSKSIRNLLTTSSETQENEIVEEKVLVNEQSSVEITEDHSTSISKSNLDNYNNKINDSIPENFKNMLNISDGFDNVFIATDKNEKLVEDLKITQSETNQDSTSKDVSTDIEQDEKESEILEFKLINDDAKETDEIMNSLSQLTEIESQVIHSKSNEFVLSKHIYSNTEVSDNLISKSSDVEEDIISKDESSSSEDQLLSTRSEYQSIQTEDHLFNQAGKDQLPSKADESQSTETDKNELPGELNENQLHSKIGDNKLSAESNENGLLKPTDENEFLTKADDNCLLSKSHENPSKTNEDELLTKTDDNCLLSKSHESTLYTTTNAVRTDSKANDELLIKTSEEFIKSNEDHVFNKTGEDLQPREEKILSTGEMSELSILKSGKSSTNKEDESRILIENKPNRLNIDTSEVKTIQSDDGTEIISDDEWNQLSDASRNQETCESLCIENIPEVSKNNLEEKEDSIKTTTSISEKIDSPLLLSYGFVERKESDDQTEFENNRLDEDHIIEDTIENTSEQESLQNSFNTEANFSEEKYQRDEKPANETNKLSADYLEHTKLKSNINRTSDNQFEDNSEDDLNQTFDSKENKSENDLNQTYEVVLEEETKHKVDANKNNETTDTPPDEKKITTELQYIDVKKRVSEILADANIPSPRGDKSPRLQDLYVTAYDVVSPEHSSSSGSPTEDIEQTFSPPHHMYGSDEVEELLKKQLEIEQEIKEIQQQQQKEHLPYLYVREIPNKPPPPYTPPVIIQTPVSGSILPVTEKQIAIIAKSAADLLHEAYLNKNLQNITLSADDRKMMHRKSNIDKNCFEFIFDLCKESAIEHYKQFETETGPSWMHLTKRSKVAIGKPLDRSGLEKAVTTKVRQWLGYEPVKSTENIKRKWSGKKRDHVDELLVVECQAEETEWTNYDRDELIVKDELTKDIMNMLLSETAQVLDNILNKKTFLC